MARKSRNVMLLLALLSAAVFSLNSQAHASSTATITVNGSEQPGDTNTITITFNGFSETAAYGKYSTTGSIASTFGAMFSRDYLPVGLCASATGNVITFMLKGTATFGALSVTGSTTSFQLTSSGFLSPSAPLVDAGTVTLTVDTPTSQNVLVATAKYGYGATPTIVAQSLADGIVSGSPVTVTAVDEGIYIEATPASVSTFGGAQTDFSYSIQNAAFNTSGTTFSSPSFPAYTISGNLGGGAATASDSGVQVYAFQAGYDLVDNLNSYTDTVMGTWTFTYDTLNRLVGTQNTAVTSASTQYASDYGCWVYDSFGNRTLEAYSTAAASTTPCASGADANVLYNSTPTNATLNNNQLANSIAGYDASGDLTADNTKGNTYLYDGEGRICAMRSEPVQGTWTMTGYLYDADGTRVAKGNITAWSCDPAQSGFSTTTDYVLGPSGEPVTEVAAAANSTMEWQRTYVYAGGAPMAAYDGDGLHFYLNDPLGSRRVQTDYAGVVEQTCTSLPFGDGESCIGGHLFTGKERDTESGNDYFGARYYASSMGRFLSPDWDAKPIDVPYAKFGDPQTLNLYSYVENGPMNRVDADGHAGQDTGKTGSTFTMDQCEGQPADNGNGPGSSQCGAQAAVEQGETQTADQSQENAQVTTQEQSANNSGNPAADSSNQDAQAQQQNNTTGYTTQDAAAKAVLSGLNPKSIKENTEYAGLIYKDSNGLFHYTNPNGGNGDSSPVGSIPKGTTEYGDYHTHGDYATPGPDGKPVRTDAAHDRYNSDHFSSVDKQQNRDSARSNPAFRGYLGTPSGALLIYNPITNREGPLQ